ncbi:MAG: hypothetical protein ACTHOH_10815 [Lysobacteraceae bacterium]
MRPAVLRRVAAVALLACALPGTAAALRIDYVADLAVERDDNVRLTDAHPIAATVLRPGLGFSATHAGAALALDLAGRVEQSRYDDARFRDHVDATLDARATWTAIPQRLRVEWSDNLSVQPVDPLSPDAPDNRQQVHVSSIGPTLSFGRDDGWRGDAGARWVRSTADVTRIFDADRFELSVRAERRLDPDTRLAFDLETQRVAFHDDATRDDAVARDYRRTQAYARWTRALSRFDLTLDAGLSRLPDLHTPAGGADARNDPLLRATLAWRPDDRQRLRVRLSRQFSDIASDRLAAVSADSGLPDTVPVGDLVVDATPYLERRLELEYARTTERWHVTFVPHANRIRYAGTTTFDRDSRGGVLDLSFRARRTLTLGVSAGIDRSDYVQLDRVDAQRRVRAWARLQRSRHWSVQAEVEHWQRRSTVPGQDAERDTVTLTVGYRNR